MSKRKRSTPKEGTPSTPAESGEGEPTVHVTSNMLAGSPDIFAPGKRAPEGEAEPAAMTADEPAVESAGPAAETPAFEAVPAATAAEEPAATAPMAPATPPSSYQPRPPAYTPAASPGRRAGSSVALGVVLVVLGAFALIVQFTGFDAGGSWPLFVVIPGLTLLVIGFISLGTGALIPGAILTVIGVILAYMNSYQDWTAWAFVWPLVAPGGVGLGIWLQGLRKHDAHLLRQGRVLMFVAFLIFLVGFVIFGTIFRIGEVDYGWFGKAALPGLLIVVGIVLLARSIQRTRQT